MEIVDSAQVYNLKKLFFFSKMSTKATPKAIYKVKFNKIKYAGCCCLPEKALDKKLKELNSARGYIYCFYMENELKDFGICITKLTDLLQ